MRILLLVSALLLNGCVMSVDQVEVEGDQVPIMWVSGSLLGIGSGMSWKLEEVDGELVWRLNHRQWNRP